LLHRFAVRNDVYGIATLLRHCELRSSEAIRRKTQPRANRVFFIPFILFSSEILQ
jgi:hypothetical protein